MSCVLPAYYVHGQITGRLDFPSWFGQNSKGAKLARFLKELTNHSHIKSGATGLAARLDVLPALFAKLMLHLKRGEAGVEMAIKLLDEYNLTKDDCDNLVELMVGGTDSFKAIPTAVKTSFTRQ